MFTVESMKDLMPPRVLEELEDLLYPSKWNHDLEGRPGW